jgi:hypothetical protein
MPATKPVGSTPTVTYYENALHELFLENWPSKIKQIPKLLAKYRGQETMLLNSLREKADQRQHRLEEQAAHADRRSRRVRKQTWEQVALGAVEADDPEMLKEAFSMDGAHVDTQLTWRSGVNWGWTNEAWYGTFMDEAFGERMVTKYGFMEGDTILHMALKTRSEKLTNAVFDLEPDLSIANCWKFTAVDIAKKCNLDHLLQKVDYRFVPRPRPPTPPPPEPEEEEVEEKGKKGKKKK